MPPIWPLIGSLCRLQVRKWKAFPVLNGRWAAEVVNPYSLSTPPNPFPGTPVGPFQFAIKIKRPCRQPLSGAVPFVSPIGWSYYYPGQVSGAPDPADALAHASCLSLQPPRLPAAEPGASSSQRWAPISTSNQKSSVGSSEPSGGASATEQPKFWRVLAGRHVDRGRSNRPVNTHRSVRACRLRHSRALSWPHAVRHRPQPGCRGSMAILSARC